MRCASLGLLSLWLAACGAQYDLRPALAAGRTYVETTDIKVDTTGDRIGTRSEQLRWVVERTVLRGGRYGVAPLAWLERVSRVVAAERGRRLMSWDSDSGAPPPHEYAAHAALSRVRAEIEVSPQGEVSVAEVHFQTDAMQRSGWSDSLIAMLKQSLRKDQLAQAAQDMLRRMPGRPVRLNDTWTSDWALLGIGARWTWQLIAVSADVARFRITGAMSSAASLGMQVQRATGEAEVELSSGLIRRLQLGIAVRQPLGDVVLEHTGSLSLTTRVR